MGRLARSGEAGGSLVLARRPQGLTGDGRHLTPSSASVSVMLKSSLSEMTPPLVSGSNAEPHVSLSAVTRVYGESLHALGPIDLSLRRGEFFSVVGPSG